MSTVIKLKYSLGTAQPADDQLNLAEQAYSYDSGKLFIGADNDGTIVPHAIGGKFFTDMLDHTAGTLTPSSALIVGSDSKIDIFNVDNIRLDGNTISSTDLNGNITLDPNGTGEISLSANTTVDGDLTVTGSIDLGGTTVDDMTVSSLTAGRVVYAGTDGLLIDSANLAFNGSTLTVTGSAAVDNVTIDGNDISTTDTNGNLTLTPNGTGLVVINKTTGLKVASGVAGTRPTAVSVGDGVIRYNETDGRFEGTVAGSWTGLGGVVDVDQDTYITAEESTDEDTLRFYTAGTQRLAVSAAGAVFTDGLGVTANGGITVDNIAIDGDTININGSTIQGTGNASAGTIVLDPAPAAGDNGGDLIVRGNLQVTGTTTTVNSTVVEIADPVMQLGSSAANDSLDRGLVAVYTTDEGTTEKSAFIGWDRGADNAFTFVPDTSVAAAGDAIFGGLALEGLITEYNGAAPTNGQLLIGNGTNFAAATLSTGNAITVTNGSGSITVSADSANAVATDDIANASYAPAADNSAALGVATFASEQFSVSSGHVVITEIDGGTF